MEPKDGPKPATVYSVRELLRQFRTGVPRGQLARLADQTPINTAVTLSLVVLISVFVYSQVSLPGILAWAAVHAGLIILVYARWRRLAGYRAEIFDSSISPTRKGLFHAFGWAAISGGLWGSLTVFLPDSPSHVQLALILCMGGMAAGASTTLAAVPQVAISFILCCGLPVTIYYLTMGTQAGLSLAFVLLIFTTALIGTSQIVHVALLRQLHAEEKANQLTASGLHQKAAVLVNRARNVRQAMQSCLDEVCQYTGWSAGHIYLLSDRDECELVSSGIWRAENKERFEELRKLTKGTRVRIDGSLPAHAVVNTKPIWKADTEAYPDSPLTIDDCLCDPKKPRAETIRDAGIRAILEIPVLVGKKVTAVLELFSSHTTKPSRRFLDTLETVASILACALERHQAEEQLRKSRESLEHAQRIAQVGSWEWNMLTGDLYWSREVYRVLGLDPHNFAPTDDNFMLTVHPDDRSAIVDATHRAVRESVPYLVDHRVVRPDGEVRYVRSLGEIERQSDGTPEWLRGTIQDLTDQRLAEQQARLLLESTAEAIYGTDLDGRCTFVNPACIRILGYQDQADLIEKDMHATIHHSRADGTPCQAEACGIYKAVRSGTGTHIAQQVLWRADGTSFPAEYRSHPIVQDGEIIGSVVTFLDITERVEAENAARREEARARNYLNIAGSIICTVDAEGTITLINQAGCEILEHDENEIVGKNMFDLFVPEDELDERRARFQRWIKGEESINDTESRIVSRSGNERIVRWKLVPLKSDDGNLHGILASGQDITEQRRTESHLIQAQKMEAVGQLTSGVAHDFNNILAVVMGNLELAVEDTSKNGGSVEYLAAALQAAQKGADLNRQLLSFSRQQGVEVKPVDTNEVVRSMLGLLGRTLGEKIQIETVLSDQSCVSRLDAAQLESVIVNLAINARDAMPNGGKLIIQTGIIAPGTFSGVEAIQTPMVHIIIRDNGVGMLPETLRRAVEPFFTTKKDGAGTGLGLSMAFGFAKRSGGWLEVDSTPGKGTDVHIFLPSCQNAAPIKAGLLPIHADEVAEGELVLVVEDKADVMTTICRHLESLGYAVLTAVDGEDAIQKIETGERDVKFVLSDIMLPGGISGIEVVSAARRNKPEIKTILMSGNPDISTNGSGIDLPDVSLLRKPFRRSDLVRALRE